MIINPMNLSKRVSEWWGSLRITSKFSLAFGLMLFILLMQTAIAYTALTITWNSNDTIQDSSEARRLVMVISTNWETVRRYQQQFFVESPVIGAEQAYQLYALPASGKISEVVKGGATLKRLFLAQVTKYSSVGEEPVLDLILSNVSQYATLLEEATNLEFELTSIVTGLNYQHAEKAELLASSLKPYDTPGNLLALFYEMQLYVMKNLATGQNLTTSETVDYSSKLRNAIQESLMQDEEKGIALKALDDYIDITHKIYQIKTEIQNKRNQLETLSQSIDPIFIELMVSADAEVNQASLQIDKTRKISVVILISAMGIGLLFTVFIAVIFHISVTRNIVKLTQIAGQFKIGSLGVRSQISTSDELGNLASTFNQMAETLERHVTEVEKLHLVSREQSIRDSLTNLFNRRYLDETLSIELEWADRNGTPITLVMLDLDHLKEVNDRFGHAIGDKMLVELASILNSQSRSGDITCRYGGDEFVTLLVGANLEVGVRRVNAWMQKFSTFSVQTKDVIWRATISAGVVERHPKETSADLLARADSELYKAKNAGRNCISATE